MATLDEVGSYIQTNGLGIKGTDLFAGVLPNKPDNVTTLHQPRPGDAVRAMSKTLDHVVEPFTITVRDLDPMLCRTRVWAMFLLLDNFTGTLDGIEYKLIWARGTPMNVGPDENSRSRWSCDFWASKSPS